MVQEGKASLNSTGIRLMALKLTDAGEPTGSAGKTGTATLTPCPGGQDRGWQGSRVKQ